MVTTDQPGEPRASLLVEQWAKQTFAILVFVIDDSLGMKIAYGEGAKKVKKN